MKTPNSVFNCIYHRYYPGTAAIYADARRNGATCYAALTAARDYCASKGAGR